MSQLHLYGHGKKTNSYKLLCEYQQVSIDWQVFAYGNPLHVRPSVRGLDSAGNPEILLLSPVNAYSANRTLIMSGTVEEFTAMRPPKALTFEDSLVILGKLLSDPGCEIMLGQKITMRDSISMKPFTHPCRAFGCKHVQCFDFEVYLHVNKSKLTSEYCCPICQQISNPSKIYVDSVFLCLLQIIPEDSTVNLMKDGTFEVTLPNKAVEIIDVDGDDEEAEFEESPTQLSGLVVGSVAELMYIVPFTVARSKKNHITLKELAEASLDDVLYLINVDNAWGINTIPDISDLLQKYIKKKRPYACTTIDGLLYCLRQVDGMGEVRAGRIVKHLFGVLQKKLTGFLVHIKSRAIVSSNGVGLSSPIVMEFLKKKGKLRSVPAPSSPAAGSSALTSSQQNRQNGLVQNDLLDRSNSDREGTADSHSNGSSVRNNTENNANIASKARSNSIISVDSSVCEDSHHSLNTPSSTTTYTTTDSFDPSLASASAQKDKRSPRSHHSAVASAHGNDTTASRGSSQVPNGLPSAAAHRAKGSSGICGEGIADVAGLPKLTRLGRNNNSSGTILLENCVAPEAAANNRAYTLHQVTVTDLCESSGSDVEASARSRELVMLAASPKQRSPRSRVTSPTASVRSANSTGAVCAESLTEATSPTTRRSKRSRTPEEPISPAGESVHSLRSRDIVDVDEAQDAISVSSASAIVPVTSPSRSKRARREAQRQETLREDGNGSVVSEMTRSGSSAASSMIGLSISNSAVAENRVGNETQLVQARASTVTPVIASERNGAPLPPTIPVISTPPAQRRTSSQNVVVPPSGTHIRFQSSPEEAINVRAAASRTNDNSSSTHTSRNINSPEDVKPFIQLNRAANGVSKQTDNNSISATALSIPTSLHNQLQQARPPSARPPQAQVLVIPPRSTTSASEVTGGTASASFSSLQPSGAKRTTSPAAKSRDYTQDDSLKYFNPRLNMHSDQNNQPIAVPGYHYGNVIKWNKDGPTTSNVPAQDAVKVFYPRKTENVPVQERDDGGFSVSHEMKWVDKSRDEASFSASRSHSKARSMEADRSWSPNSQHGHQHSVQKPMHPSPFALQNQWSSARSPERRVRSRSRERAPGSRFNDAENDRARKAHNAYYNNSDRSDRESRDSRDGSRGRTRENSRDRGGYGHFHQDRDGHSRDRERGYRQHHDQDGGNKGNTFFSRTNNGPDRGHYVEKEHAVGWRSETALVRDSWNYQPPPLDGRGQDQVNEKARDRGWRTENQTVEHPSASLQAPVAPLPAPPAASNVASVRPPPPVQIGSRGYNQAPTVVTNFPGLNVSRSVGLVRQSAHPPPAPSTLARAGAVSSAAVAVPSTPSAVFAAPAAVPSVQPVPVAAKPPAPPALAPTPAPTEAVQSVPSTGRTTPWRPPEPKLPPPKIKGTSTAGSSSDTSSTHTTHSTSKAYNNISQSVTSAKTKGIVIMYEGKVVPEPPTSSSVTVATADTTVNTAAVPSAPAFAPKKKAQNNAKLVDTQPTPVNSEHVSATSIAQHKPNNSFHNNNFVDRRHIPQNALSTGSTGYRAATGNTNSYSTGSFRDGYNNHTNNPYKAIDTNNSHKSHEEGETFSSLVVRNFSATQE